MLGDGRTDRCSDERGHCRDVDRVREIAAGAHDIKADQVCRQRHPVAVFEHDAHQGADLVGSLTLGAQAHGEGTNLGRGGHAIKDLLHSPRDTDLVKIGT